MTTPPSPAAIAPVIVSGSNGMIPNSSPPAAAPPSAMAKRDAAANFRQFSSLASSCFDPLLEPRDLLAGVGGLGR